MIEQVIYNRKIKSKFSDLEKSTRNILQAVKERRESYLKLKKKIVKRDFEQIYTKKTLAEIYNSGVEYIRSYKNDANNLSLIGTGYSSSICQRRGVFEILKNVN